MRNLLIFIAVWTALNMNAQIGEKNFIDLPYIEVNGKAEMEVVPDMIYLEIVLSEKDNKNKLSIAELDKRFISKLKEMDVDVTKDLTLKDLSSSFKSQFILKDDIILTKEYQLIVHSGQVVGRVARELEQVGISNITILKTDHSKIEEYRLEVKAKAMKAAKKNAEAMALAIDQSVGRAIFVQEQFSNIYRASNVMMMKSAGPESFDAGNNDPSVDFEKIKLDFNVLVRFELK